MSGSADLVGFADAARSWLDTHASSFTVDETAVSSFPAHTDEEEHRRLDAALRWQAHKFAHGYAGLAVPTELGGRGLTRAHDATFTELEATYSLPTHDLDVTLGMVLPTLVAHAPARPDIRDTLAGSVLWCQLFSEPGAGSDLAAQSTRATPTEGGGWRIRGQKVWTTGAHLAQRGYLLARTADGPRYHDLTAFVIDMTAPGVVVRRLTQVTGGSTFNEVYLDDVDVPDSDRIGDVGAGWRVAMTTLMNERLAVGADQIPVARLRAEADARGLSDDPIVRDRLGEVLVRQRVLDQLRAAIYRRVKAGGDPGPASSAGKLFLSDSMMVAADVARLVTEADDGLYTPWTEFALAAIGVKIAGGTDEIQKTILADRVLGLPRELRSPAEETR